MSTAPLKLLVVDDEPHVELLFRQRFRRRLRKGDLDLAFARDGVEALERLEADDDIRIVLSDINMPRMDGLTLLDRVREMDRVIELVIISAYGDMANIRAAMNRGAFDFLTKPLDFTDLDATITKTHHQVQRLIDAARAREQAARLARHNAFIRETFGRYVSDDVVDELLDQPEGLVLGGARRTVTVLSSDLRGFTALSEQMPPEEVVAILNDYFEAMFQVILAHKGTINGIVGDGLFVLFGAPIARPDDTERAIACAIDMQRALQTLRRRPGFPVPSLEMGIGINRGPAVVGNIGSRQRSHYSAVGRDVNLAARVEGSTVGGQILVTEQALAGVDVPVETRSRFELRLKGVADPIVVAEVVGIGGAHATAWVPPSDAVTPLDSAIAVRFRRLDAKVAVGRQQDGRLTALSTRRALLVADPPPEPLTDLQLEL
ncbi:MAG: adenylate/guanylate cyclase domain-containing response regulator, partial [Deltaproteobacteria bacterium]